MDTLDQKKINLLVHLAKIDGKFEKSEREILYSFLRTKGLPESSLDNVESPVKFSDFAHTGGKIELLYWMIQLVQADRVIHEKELLFCRNLMQKLNFKDETFDHYVNQTLPEFETFEKQVNQNWLREK